MNSDVIWNRILAHAGDTFHQIRGKPFTYDASGRTIQLHTTNRMISRTAIERALAFVPLSNTTPIQHISAPSYIYALLTDPRIIGETQSDRPLPTTERLLRELLEEHPQIVTNLFGPGDFEDLPQPRPGSFAYRMENSSDILGVIVAPTRADGRTIEQVDYLIAELRNATSTHVACLVIADGRDAAFRSAETSRDDVFYESAQGLVFAARGPMTRGAEAPLAIRKPNVPDRDSKRQQNDPYDSDAVAFLLARPGASRWSRGTLFEHLRGQPRLDQERVDDARSFGLRHGVEVRTHSDGTTAHFFRTDPDAPYPYPTSEAERKAWRSGA